MIEESKREIINIFIKEKYEKGYSWDDIKYACSGSLEGLRTFLENSTIFLGSLTEYEWMSCVESIKTITEKRQMFKVVPSTSAMVEDEKKKKYDVEIINDPGSFWHRYKGKSLSGFSKRTIENIENTNEHILKQLTFSSEINNPTKGLVVGNVQSGKTANMAALMAIAADNGWNFFIVLSGTITNLRNQTSERLLRDLTFENGYSFESATTDNQVLSLTSTTQLSNLELGKNSSHRYLYVCMKNSSTLRKLLEWINSDLAKKKQLKILLIDDESDQASINTRDLSKGENEERTITNKYINYLVEAKKANGKEGGLYSSMNYIGYTATPYACVLRECESLYPKDFIAVLDVATNYFGPQQIFGVEGDPNLNGLDIVREISEKDLDIINSLQEGDGNLKIPKSLENAICWFFDCVATWRYWGIKKPLSMLIHTSAKVDFHEHIAKAIMDWKIKSDFNSILEKCRDVWENETKRFSLDDFKKQFPTYAMDSEEYKATHFDCIKNYPKFEEILSELSKLVFENFKHIKLGDKEEKIVSHGRSYDATAVHLCIDNCKKSKIENEDEWLRIVYPKEADIKSPGPAFIVIGGSTLSRGLTLEGLVSSYFLRPVGQADTLMQMGRWFGYRKGYELLPRIWLSASTLEKFEYLSMLDIDLRKELEEMEVRHISPSEYAPRVLSFPGFVKLKITMPSKMLGASEASENEINYTGTRNQTTIFHDSKIILENNLNLTNSFILDLGQPINKKDFPSNYLWRGVDSSIIFNYLKKLDFPSAVKAFSNLKDISEWVENMTKKGLLESWNVILAGVKINEKNLIRIGNLPLGMVNRSHKGEKEDYVYKIGALRAPNDEFTDVELDSENKVLLEMYGERSAKTAYEIREKAGIEKIPQLIIYIVDKNSTAKEEKNGVFGRQDLNAVENIVGVCLNIPRTKELTRFGGVKVCLTQLKKDNKEKEDIYV